MTKNRFTEITIKLKIANYTILDKRFLELFYNNFLYSYRV